MPADDFPTTLPEAPGPARRGSEQTAEAGRQAATEPGPSRQRTGADLRAALVGSNPPDDRFAEDIADALALLTTEDRDPWADA